MDDDQQFCLRWNNHQSTLVSVFDSLLEHEKLVDCTLAAEGKLLKAHKVVLSACSPYFETLLSRHYDKHPILILKDVKFQELKAMMDYMYRGEVNISQDQLGALLKAAESLQIKGLSDNKRDEPVNKRTAPATAPPKSPQMQAQIPKVQGLTIEQRNQRDDNREGSMSPSPRKRKRMRRKSEEMDNHHDASNSSDAHSLPSNIPSAPTQLPANIKMNSDVPDTIETKQEMISRHKDDTGSQPAQVPMMKEKLETHSELMLEPKSEYVEEMNEDSIEDLTLDDDDLSNMEQMDDGAGPSHGGEGSSQQGFGHWQMGGNQSQDEVFLAAQEAVGAHRDSQGSKEPKKPLVKILKVEDLKSDQVVARIKKELAGTLSFGKPDLASTQKSSEGRPVQKSAERVGVKPNFQIKLEVPEGTQMVELQHEQSEPEDIEEEVIIDCDSTITQKDISALGSDSRVIIVQEATRGVFTRERREKFINMTISDLPKKEKFEKCLRPLEELSKPVDQIRCANCGILFKSSLIAKHEFLCQGQRKKSKFGCMYCSFTHDYLQELEEHILKQHSKNKL
ncbi:longitudinals lacking protein, isoforms J/P/Q/S/Z isoform X8 [Dendroctonus ponderosae]|uniref:BTB domain-containing protein n=2 Tax=Dendroctonus ponderosae TaxID=77166 RepID=A0AAR5PZ16_DENPD|nr:longitudinals lacking protein, isoforms J/P/Q/S/Z isoform X8 [Dendroctonus ponderosae]